MNPRIQDVKEDGNTFTFTLSGVNTSLANALRRTIISDIPTVVFRTTPYEENKANFMTNTTRLNNEILKQRLSCIPIHISDLEMPLQNYILEVNVENLTDTIQYVTTEDFKVKNLTTNKFLSEKDNKAIFPQNEYGCFIDFARLRPKISDEIPGEKLHFTCEFSLGTAKENAMFNCVSTCSYGFTLDDENIEKEIGKRVKHWKDQGLSKDQIDFEAKNWKLLEGQRIVKKDSFDFIIETIGVFSNQELVKKACDILINKLTEMDTLIDKDELKIIPSQNTIPFSYDIILENEDYTIGKVIEFMLYAKFFEDLKTLSYCGFKKMHPHDSDSIVRIAYKEMTDGSTIKQNIKSCIADAISVFEKISEKF
jgi:DNA-directed RNA polymerase alpha subunit